MLITFREIFDMAVMTAFVGFIFSDLFGRFRNPRRAYAPLKHGKSGMIDWENFKFAAYVTAPALILHELAHKFFAMGFGIEATFHAAYWWLMLGLALKLMRFNFIFFVPAYVSIIGSVSPLQHSLIAFAGPGMNLVLWLGTAALIKYKMIGKKYFPLAVLTSKINMFLFIFNLLPIPGFDGYWVFSGIIQAFF